MTMRATARKQTLNTATVTALRTAGLTRRVDDEVPKVARRGAAVASVGCSKPTTRDVTALPYDPCEGVSLHARVFTFFFVGLFYTIDSMNHGDKVPHGY